MAELTGIRSGDGAKMKAEVGADHVAFRGAIKADVPFEEITAEARGTLLVLSFRGNVVELGAGGRASQLAAKVRSPPDRLARFGIEVGMTVAVAGPLDPSFKSALAARGVLVAGVPKSPVEALFFAVASTADLQALPKLVPLLAAGGTLWIVHPVAMVAEKPVLAAGNAAGLRLGASVRFSATHSAAKFQKP